MRSLEAGRMGYYKMTAVLGTASRDALRAESLVVWFMMNIKVFVHTLLSGCAIDMILVHCLNKGEHFGS